MAVRYMKAVDHDVPEGAVVEQVHIEGGGQSYTLPAASASEIGGVMLATAVSDVSAADAAQAAGDTVTKSEFDAVVAVANESKAQVNALMAALRASGALAES